jgi:diadenosine tetraphosphatase ApaH/serine/threonine PP2A family protein phosphatase
MRYAVFSDVHGNLEALDVVLADARRHHPEVYLCLGDIVGYGPDPNECVARVRALKGLSIAGNHDRAAAGLLDPFEFNQLARQALEWTKRVLTREAKAFLASLPVRLETEGLLAVHGSPRDPVEEYIDDLPTALAVFTASGFSLCLVGHSHIPGIYALGDDGSLSALTFYPGEPVRLAPTSRYIINVGSVGQPRDGDPRAAYLTLDTATHTIVLRRLEYPMAVTQTKVVANGLPPLLADRLGIGF